MATKTNKIIEEQVLPERSVDLIDQLDKAYPHKCVSKTDTIMEAQWYASKRELIDELLSMKKEHEEGDL